MLRCLLIFILIIFTQSCKRGVVVQAGTLESGSSYIRSYDTIANVGEYTMFYPTGELEAKGTLVDNKFEGEYTCYYLDGSVETKVFYKQGKLYGHKLGYYQDGKSYFSYPYEDGKLNGVGEYYYKDGSLKALNLFVDDSLYAAKFHLADGSIKETVFPKISFNLGETDTLFMETKVLTELPWNSTLDFSKLFLYYSFVEEKDTIAEGGRFKYYQSLNKKMTLDTFYWNPKSDKKWYFYGVAMTTENSILEGESIGEEIRIALPSKGL